MSSLTFVVRKSDQGWVIRSHGVLGDAPVGPRLAKGTPFPSEFGTKFSTKKDADVVCHNWNEWYKKQPYLKKKQKTKYLA